MSESRASARPRALAKKGSHSLSDDPDRVNEREFYRYYHPSQRTKDCTREPSPPPVDFPTSLPTPVLPHSPPSIGEDIALSAFAQLGALRLNARRCLISFFDRRNCYVLAEATKSMCLKSGQVELHHDNLYWGTAIFRKEKSICYNTMKLPFGHPADPNDEYSAVPSLVINDLSRDDRFKQHPVVVGPPYSRFYASVPIRSPNGHSIGTYSVYDDKPRTGISDFELIFLKDMATTIMRHLQMSRATDDHLRGGIMVRSLGSFAEGRSSLDEWLDWEADLSATTSATLDDPEHPQPRRSRRPTISHADSNGSSISSLKTVGALSSNMTPISAVETLGSDGIESSRSEVTTKTASSTNGLNESVSPELKTVFSRAAQMIVDATEAAGAVFFDAKVSTWGGLVDDDVPSDQPPEPDKSCIILGAAHCKKENNLPESPYAYDLSENELKHLLRNYPHGQIVSISEDEAIVPVSPPEELEIDLFRKSESSRGFEDESILKNVFPVARSLILYPLWDTHRGKWYSCLMVYSVDPFRVFTSEQELSYLAAFSNSVMAEVIRLDTKIADSAKADFISSISHELRSPLHGILGMSDLLKETQIDSQQSSHIQTIETCGKTLLDTINHVLDYAKINNLTRGSSKRRMKRSKMSKQMNPGQGHTNDIMTIISDVDVSVLTEEALDSVFAGFRFQQSANLDMTNNCSPVPIVVDINKSDYNFRSQPGALRRVIMNLFGNALKYTPHGHIKIKLSVVPNDDIDEDCAELRLTVTDSGIGMSEGYINNRIFHSFAQENPLSQGTGLGLSIVKQLVELLGGDVEVRSEKGRGTKFTVSCPMKKSSLSSTACPSLSDSALSMVSKRTKNLNVHFVGFGVSDNETPSDIPKNKNATYLTKKAVENMCIDWFDVKTWTYGAAGAPPPDLYIATENGAHHLRTLHSKNPNTNAIAPPVVVLCRGAASAQSTTAITVPGLIFECVAQPCGPHKLARALSSVLDRHANRVMVESAATDSPSTLRISESSDSLHRPHHGQQENRSPPGPSRLSALARSPSRPAMTATLSAPEIRTVEGIKKASESPDPKISLNCLLVDDNPINLRLLKTFAQKLGHRHVLAKTGLEALDAYKLSYSERKMAGNTSPLCLPSIDVVLMDINMPEMDGLESTRQIRAFERDHGLPPTTIIALTGVASTDTQQEAHASGINLFLIKPVRLAELDVILKSVIKSLEHNESCGKAGDSSQSRDHEPRKSRDTNSRDFLAAKEENSHARSKSSV